MAIIVYGYATAIHGNYGWYKGCKGFEATDLGIVDF